MPYKIISKIASGTFGTVYKVQKSTNGELYALKLIHENYKTPKELKRIKRGFETAQKVSHPNCVKMIEWYENGKDIGFVMEFVESVETQNLASSPNFEINQKTQNLASSPNFEINQKTQNLAPSPNFEINQKTQNLASLQGKISKIIQIANGLEALHSRGIVHRDLKPANILETKDGQIKITDFDLVKLDDSSTLTVSGAFLGTAKYSSPEQCQNSAKIDHRSDLYSLGVIFYQLLTGRLPFEGDSVTSIILGHLRSPLISPSQFNPEIPFTIEEIVKTLLRKNPIERFKSAKEVAEKLNDFLKKPEISKGKIGKSFLLFPEFIGREKELQILQNSFSEAEKGITKLIFIGGKSGSGKTKLWKEFTEGLNRKDTFYLHTKSNSNLQSFEALKNLLNQCLTELEFYSDIEKIDFVGDFGRDLQIISPQIKEMSFWEKLPKTVILENNETLLRLFETLCEFLLKLKKEKTLVLFFDDFQWLDGESAKWIKFAQNYFKNDKILIAGTIRKNENEKSNFEQQIEEFEKLELANLDLGQIKKFIASMLGQIDPIETKVAEIILSKTNGNPLFIQEMMFHLLEKEILYKSENKWFFKEIELVSEELPKTIHSIISERFKNLPRKAKEILQTATLVGDSFEFEFLASLLPKLKDEEILVSLKEACFENYLTDENGKFAFYHNSVKETLRNEISASAKIKLHKLIAERLEKGFSETNEEILGELAHHFFEAKIKTKAKKYSLLAFEFYKNKYSLLEALKFISQVIELENNEIEKVKLLLKKSEIARESGKPEEAEKSAILALEISKKLKNNILEAESLFAIGREQILKFELENGEKNLQIALTTFQKLEEPLMISKVFYSLAELFAVKGDFSQALDFCHKALEKLDLAENPKQVFKIYFTIGAIYSNLRDVKNAMKFLNKSIKIANKVNDFVQINFLNSSKGDLYQIDGKPEKAFPLFQKSLKNSEKIGHQVGIVQALGGIGVYYFHKKKYSKVIEFSLKCVQIQKQMGDNLGLLTAMSNIVYGNYLLGNFGESRVFLEQFKTENDKIKNDSFSAIYFKVKAQIAFEEQNYEVAIKNFDESLAFRNDFSNPTIMILKAECLFLQNEFEATEKLISETKELAEKFNDSKTIFKTELLSLKLNFQLGNQKESLLEILEIIKSEQNEDFSLDARFEFCMLFAKKENLTLLPGVHFNFEEFKKETLQKFRNQIQKDEGFLLKKRLVLLENLQNNSGIFHSGLLNSLVPLMEPETVLNEITEHLISEIKAEHCFIILKNSLSGKLEPCSISSNFDDEEINFSKTILDSTIKNEKAFLVGNALESEEFSTNESIIGKIFLSVISVPLKIKNEIIGAIYLDRKDPKLGVFKEKDLGKVKKISELLLPALQKQKENLNLKIKSQIRDLGVFVGNSPKMQKIYKEIESASTYNFPVYIFGETGTGKELVANALHKLSPRRNEPFIAINCSAIPKNLTESELFGHKKGAFTGANFDKKGVFELAENGTLLLDEVGDLTLENQAKLLRVIQEKKLRVIGSEKFTKVNARILVATHKNLEEEVQKGNFREDLLHRLDVLKISIPPLRERIEDIPLLAFHILNKFNSDYGKKIQGFSNEVFDVFSKRSWKGNVRELENSIIKAAVKQKSNQKLTLGNFNFTERSSNQAPQNNFNRTEKFSVEEMKELLPLFEGNTLSEKVAFFEKIVFEKTLEDCNWNKTKAAEKLGISRTHVHRILNRIKPEK